MPTRQASAAESLSVPGKLWKTFGFQVRRSLAAAAVSSPAATFASSSSWLSRSKVGTTTSLPSAPSVVVSP